MAVQPAAVQTVRFKVHYLRAKRILDLTFTLLIAPLVLLVGLIVAVCIKLDSKGPVFFRQKRIGQHGVEFEMLKFRRNLFWRWTSAAFFFGRCIPRRFETE